MTDYTVSKRQIDDNGIERTEIVFNYTDADYFSLVPAEEVSEFQMPLIYCVLEGQRWPLEVRTVRGNYRNGLYFFTIVRLETGFFYNRDNSFGRQIAINVGEYFGDVLFRRSDLYGQKNRFYSFDEHREGFRSHIYGMEDIENTYVHCFSPSHQSEGYYYKAYTGFFSELEEGTPCPFGNAIEDTSLVDRAQEKSLQDRIYKLKAKIISIPEDPYKQDRINNEIKEMLKERRVKRERIGLLKKETTRERYKQEIEHLTAKIRSNPYWPAYAVYEDDEYDAATLENERLNSEKDELESQLRGIQSKEFRRLRRACYKECGDCPFYDFGASLRSSKVICKISSGGLQGTSLNLE